MTNLTNAQREILKFRLPSGYNVDDFEAVEFNPPKIIPYEDYNGDEQFFQSMQDKPVTFFKKKGSEVEISLPAKLGKDIIFCGDTKVFPFVEIGKKVLFCENVIVQSRTVIGYHCFIGNNTDIGTECTIGHSVIINDDVGIGHKVTIGKHADIAPSIELYSKAVVEDYEEVTKSRRP